MICPGCKSMIPDDSRFCQVCGRNMQERVTLNYPPLSDPFSTLGDLDRDICNNIQDDHIIDCAHHDDGGRVHDVGKDGLWRDKKVHGTGRNVLAASPKKNAWFCTSCGNAVPADSVFCEHCGKKLLAMPAQKKFQWKKWMTVAVCCSVLLLVTLAIPLDKSVPIQNNMHASNTTSNGFDELTPPAGYDEINSITQEYLDTSVDAIYKMKEHNGDKWFCRISVPAWITASPEKVDTGDAWNPNYIYLFDASEYEDLEFCSVTKGTDQMVIVGITGVSCTPIIEMDYTIPYYLAAYSGSIHYRRSIGYMIGGYNEDFEEINGQDPSNYLNRLSKRYNVFRAKKGETFTFSYYSGTDYLEDTVIANHYYYIIGDYKTHISLPITKTTEGYFLVDYSELSPGYYWFSVGNRETIIEIRE